MLLYHNKIEYARVVETVSVTEEGMFLKDKTPDDYSGAVLDVELVHHVLLTDSSGYLEVWKLDNPSPQDKDRNSMEGNAVNIDGNLYRAGAGPAREWRIVPAKHLPAEYKTKADITKSIMVADGALGTRL